MDFVTQKVSVDDYIFIFKTEKRLIDFILDARLFFVSIDFTI